MDEVLEKMNKEIEKLSQHYDILAQQYGYSPSAVQQSSLETQEQRLSILLEVTDDIKHKKILDFGCGTGHLLSLLKAKGFQGEYVGYDISDSLLAIAREHHPEGRFELKNILTEDIDESFDFIFISGVFNNDIDCNEVFMQEVLSRLFPKASESLAFNALSRYVDYFSEDLYYFDPMLVFQWCKENLSPKVTLRHDYEVKSGVIPFEFTCYVYATDHNPVKIHQR